MTMNFNQLSASWNCQLILILIFYTINTTTTLEEKIVYPTDSYEDELCTTNAGKAGKCVEVSKCQSIEDLIHTKEPPVTCGMGPFEEIICCPEVAKPSRPEIKKRPVTIACSEIEEGLILPSSDFESERQVYFGEYPHMASLGYEDMRGKKYKFDCGSTLIASRFVLTAAHCVVKHGKPPAIVRLGVTDMDDLMQQQYAVDIPIKKFHIHPEYLISSPYHDIAILELIREVKYSFNVYPACLSTDPEYPSAESNITVTGWGVITDAPSRILLKDYLEVVSLEACHPEYAHYSIELPQSLLQSQMCAVDRQDIRLTCQEDSGGIMNIVVDESLRQYKIVGIQSKTYNCGSLKPGVYTRVSEYLDYIESVVWPTSGAI